MPDDNPDQHDGFAEDVQTHTFAFRLPGDSSPASTRIDLKWLHNQQQSINTLFNIFVNTYSDFVEAGMLPASVLRAHFEVVNALAQYQHVLLEHQDKREGHIESEAEMHEFMSQMDNFIKNFRQGK